jgi:hypothetical protein
MSRSIADDNSKQYGRIANVVLSLVGVAIIAISGWQESQAEIDNPPEGYDYWQPIEAMGAVVYVVGISAGRILMSLFPAGMTLERIVMFVVSLFIAGGAIWISSTANLPIHYYAAGLLPLIALLVQDVVTGPLEEKEARKARKAEKARAKRLR